jgi:type III secretory pathway lipoprotein EscJ
MTVISRHAVFIEHRQTAYNESPSNNTIKRLIASADSIEPVGRLFDSNSVLVQLGSSVYFLDE